MVKLHVDITPAKGVSAEKLQEEVLQDLYKNNKVSKARATVGWLGRSIERIFTVERDWDKKRNR